MLHKRRDLTGSYCPSGTPQTTDRFKGGRGGRIRTLGPRFWSFWQAVDCGRQRSTGYSRSRQLSIAVDGLGYTVGYTYALEFAGLVVAIIAPHVAPYERPTGKKPMSIAAAVDKT